MIDGKLQLSGEAPTASLEAPLDVPEEGQAVIDSISWKDTDYYGNEYQASAKLSH